MSDLEVQIAVAKVSKWASRESGDTVEVVERPRGGMSVVVADGQRSGQSAKAISNLVVRRAIGLLAEGVRDGAVARAAHDSLQATRGGQVSAELTIVSVDLVSRTLVVSRNARCPALLRCGGDLLWLDAESEAVGIHLHTRPAITEHPLAPCTTLVVITDGVWAAGARSGARIDLPGLLAARDPDGCAPAPAVADAVLDVALELDRGRPHDDATVLVVKVVESPAPDPARRMSLRFPI
jgi:serine phosphatase RsbU (regulator of sigma subunit)